MDEQTRGDRPRNRDHFLAPNAFDFHTNAQRRPHRGVEPFNVNTNKKWGIMHGMHKRNTTNKLLTINDSHLRIKNLTCAVSINQCRAIQCEYKHISFELDNQETSKENERANQGQDARGTAIIF